MSQNKPNHQVEEKIKSKATPAKIKQERDEYLAGWQRALADYKNLQVASAKDRQTAMLLGREQVLLDLIALADSFDMAFADQDRWQTVNENWRQGVERIHGQLESIFKRYELIKMTPAPGDDFDPQYHESVGSDEVDDQANEGKITSVLKTGYRLANKVIRPAQVKIGSGPTDH